MNYSVDLNCDVGEGIGPEALIMPMISSANIACGEHAGDAGTMRQAVRLAIRNHVSIGAHPGLADREHFGRREMTVSPQQAHELVRRQIEALLEIVQTEGGHLSHVKPHGALYNMAAMDAALAEAIASAVRGVSPALILFGLSGSELIAAGRKLGLATASEVFADRTYQPDGSLTPRSQVGAVAVDAVRAGENALRMIRDGKATAVDGTDISVRADTICIHADTPNAAAFVAEIHRRLVDAGIVIRAPGRGG